MSESRACETFGTFVGINPIQRVGCYPKAGQGCGSSHPSRMSHLAGNRHHDLPDMSLREQLYDRTKDEITLSEVEVAVSWRAQHAPPCPESPCFRHSIRGQDRCPDSNEAAVHQLTSSTLPSPLLRLNPEDLGFRPKQT